MGLKALIGGLSLSGIMVAFLCGWSLGVCPHSSAQDSPATDGWLKGSEAEKFDQLEAHLRGLDVAMIEIGYRFAEVYFAGKDRNWTYAKYQAEKIGLAMDLAIRRRPKRAASATPFLADEVPAILKAIDSHDGQVFQRGMERLRSACMSCHVAEKVQDFTIEFPEHRLSTIRTSR
ncbi:MAG: hypothetical protein HY716_01865 [Planctomycetes bacterium]|nr:hypothetical protein [Planctomycetota bacterium]